MNGFYKFLKYVMLSATLLANLVVQGQAQEEMTPTDVYYLAQLMDKALVVKYKLPDESFVKKRISHNLRPRNVYQKAIAVVEEFNVIHPGSVDRRILVTAVNRDAGSTRPQDVYELLSVMRKPLEEGYLVEFSEVLEVKTPSDVYQMLRQLSWRHQQIAERLAIETDWATPAQVYEALVINILPAVQAIADEAGLSYEDYTFPTQPVKGLIPRYIYKLLSHVYGNIAEYYSLKGDYDPIVLEAVLECDDISPADVFDLIQVITAELRTEIGLKSLNPTTASNYAKWKAERDTIVPGHVFRLVQYNFILSKNVLELMN